MIEGRTVTQISRNPRLNDGRPMGGLIEVKHNVVTFKQYLRANKQRKHDLIQFYADPGGLRTVNAEDLVL